MTLRIRLVGALVLLAAVGLAVFGYSTYSLYSRTQYDRLDDQLRTSRQPITFALYRDANIVEGGPGPGTGGDFIPAPRGTYAELRDATGRTLSTRDSSTGDVPKIPADIATRLATIDVRGNLLFTTDSTSGSTQWRVSVGLTPDGDTIIVAFPTSEVTDALNRLLLIEGTAAAALLVLLASGSWLIIRRGLRPLEQMATSARSITAGALSQRVVPSDARTEVGQLGLALNTMLGELEDAFAERDATEHKLRRFLADASHELRTPLTSIQGFAELFRLGAADNPEDLAIVLRRIEQESARMKTLVDDLLLLARLDQTRPAERVQVDLAVLAADACSDTRAVAPDRAVSLDAPRPVMVLGDPGHLRQAIGNLLANAVRHTPAGTPIQVWARVEGDTAVFTVRDHGPGLDDEAREHVFDRFWQADAARVGAGSGLGLSIVESIAREHGGEAGVVNAPGGGAVFSIRLPHVSNQESPARGLDDAPVTVPASAPQPQEDRA